MSSPALERRFLIACVPTPEAHAFVRRIQLRGVLLDDVDGMRETVMDSSTPGHSTVMAWVRSSSVLLEWLKGQPLVRSCAPSGVAR